MNEWDEMRQKANAARNTIEAAESAAATIAYLIKWRLKAMKIPSDTLIALKKELRNFNIHTGTWSKKARND